MHTIETQKDLKIFLDPLRDSKSIGLVPTMGALHQGHLALVKKALAENDQVVVSIFVNPTQFDNPEDLKKYPNTLEADKILLQGLSEEIALFAPSVGEMYPDKTEAKDFDFDGLDKVMEGAHRDGHFDGVGTIVEHLLRLVRPNRAYFGEKDYQQLQIIKKLVSLQELPIQIVGCPIVREANGLAMSSRNQRLSAQMREKASVIYRTLQTAKKEFGTKNVLSITEWVKAQFDPEAGFDVEYVSIVDAETLLETIEAKTDNKYRIFIAVYAEGVRLIDNIALN
jgi:pantoate--beta-alanine ligase